MLFLVELCENPNVLKIVLLTSYILKVIWIIVPILLIVVVLIDFVKNVISGKEEEQKKNLNTVIKRIIMAIAVYLVPSIVSLIMNLLGSDSIGYFACIENANLEDIKYYQSIYDEEKKTTKQTTDSNDDTNPQKVIPVVKKPTKASQLKLYTSTSGNENPKYVKAPDDNTPQKVQSFAITDMGNNNETIWYVFQKYDGSNQTFINAYNNNQRVYSTILAHGGEGQGVDIEKIGTNTYGIYCQGMNKKSIYYYTASTSSKYNNNYDNFNLNDKGINYNQAVEVAIDPDSEYAIVKKENLEVTSYKLKSSCEQTFKSSNSIKTFKIAHPSSIQGGDLSGKYYYYLYGIKSSGNSKVYIYCYDITTGENVWSSSIEVGSRIKDLIGSSSNIEPEGIKIYYYKGSYKIFIGYRTSNYKSAIFYFDV